MDDDLQQLEAELKSLLPAAPSAALRARVERALADDVVAGHRGDAPAVLERTSARPSAWWWLAFPAAAAILLALGRGVGGPPGVPTRSDAPAGHVVASNARGDATVATLKPVQADNILVEASDEGLVTLADGTRARRERLQFVDTIVWKNARTNASLTWSVPREEVRVVPIVFQ